MPFILTEEQDLVRRTVHELAEGGIAKRARAADHDMAFPKPNVGELACLGLLGIMVPADAGGAGADAETLAIACEEIGAACGATGAFLAVTNAWVTYPIAKHGNPTLREEWLPQLLSGAKLGTFGLHEDAVGADPFRLRTSARPHAPEGRSGERVTPGDATHEVGPAILSGTKDLTFLVGLADLILVVARRGQDAMHRRVDLYAVPGDREGVIWGKDESKLGLRGYPTGPLYLDKIRLEPEDLVGEPGTGPDIARRCGQLLSIGIAATAVGLTRAAHEAAVRFANERQQFGVPIARFEAIQHGIADIRVSIEAARHMVMHAAAVFDRDGEAPEAVDLANMHTFDLAKKATRLAIRVHGGAGFMRELPVERYARDVRTLSSIGRSPDVSRSLVGLHDLGTHA